MTPATQAAVEEVQRKSERLETPLGAGRMVWRRWGEGRPVLLLHGGSGSWLHWLRTIPVLAPSRTVWVPDLPGFGESDVPPEPWTRESYAALVQEALGRLPVGSDALDIVGFSMGAGIAAPLARSLDGRVRHLVLSGANFIVDPAPVKRDLKSVRRLTDPVERRRAFRHNLRVMMLAHTAETDETGLDLYEYDTLRRRLPRHTFSNAAGMRQDLPQIRLQGRLSVISGADDQVIGHGPKLQAEALKALRPDADYVAIERAGHWVMHEGAEAYSAALLKALS